LNINLSNLNKLECVLLAWGFVTVTSGDFARVHTSLHGDGGMKYHLTYLSLLRGLRPSYSPPSGCLCHTISHSRGSYFKCGWGV